MARWILNQYQLQLTNYYAYTSMITFSKISNKIHNHNHEHQLPIYTARVGSSLCSYTINKSTVKIS